MGRFRMLEDTKKERVIAITSYCNTEEKLNVLIVNISLIRSHFPNYKIALHANYPLGPDIQKLVDMYFYEDLNYIPENKWIQFWNTIGDKNGSFFNKKFYYTIPDTGFSVFQQIKALTRYLIDYKWVMLINYDTSVEEINADNYTEEYDLTLHYHYNKNNYSLIMMFFNPRVFYEKVASNFTIKSWGHVKRNNQMNEERFFHMVNESGITLFAHDNDPKTGRPTVSDKVGCGLDYLKPNAPLNPYFTNYLLYHHKDILEVYFWGLQIPIEHMDMMDEHGKLYTFNNKNYKGAFECVITTTEEKFETIDILKINDIRLKEYIPLKIKKGYKVLPIN